MSSSPPRPAPAAGGIVDDLVAEVERLRFAPPVAYVYDPLVYARRSFDVYLARYVRPPVPVLLLGMNPGPFGMAQTGIPFGDPTLTRDWLGICEPVGRPPAEHPRRPVLGWDSPRGEVSGRRLWGWARDRFGTPERFFARFVVLNYCPLCFIEASGRNRTPDRLPRDQRTALFAACDAALRRWVAWLQPRFVVGVGRFAAARAAATLGDDGVVVGTMLHPSPANPAANRDWAGRVTAQLRALGIEVPETA